MNTKAQTTQLLFDTMPHLLGHRGDEDRPEAKKFVMHLWEQGLLDLEAPLRPHQAPLIQSMVLSSRPVPAWLHALVSEHAPHTMHQAHAGRAALQGMWETWVNKREEHQRGGHGPISSDPGKVVLETFLATANPEWDWLSPPQATVGVGWWQAALQCWLPSAWVSALHARAPLGTMLLNDQPLVWIWAQNHDTSRGASYWKHLTKEDWQRPLDVDGVTLPLWEHMVMLRFFDQRDSKRIDEILAPLLDESHRTRHVHMTAQRAKIPLNRQGGTGLVQRAHANTDVDAWGIPAILHLMYARSDLHGLMPASVLTSTQCDAWGRPWRWHAQRLKGQPLTGVPENHPPLLGALYQSVSTPIEGRGSWWTCHDWLRVLARQGAWSETPSPEMCQWVGQDEVSRSQELASLMQTWPRTIKWLSEVTGPSRQPSVVNASGPNGFNGFLFEALPSAWQGPLLCRKLLHNGTSESMPNLPHLRTPLQLEAWDENWLAQHGEASLLALEHHAKLATQVPGVIASLRRAVEHQQLHALLPERAVRRSGPRL